MVQVYCGKAILSGLLTEEQCAKAVKEGKMKKLRPQVYQYITQEDEKLK